MPKSTEEQPDNPWLTAMLPFVRDHLPSPPARVLEVGCGPTGGFVPALSAIGYDTVGVDPNAPEGVDFRQMKFEQYDTESPVDAVIASVSLHHVSDLGVVFDRMAGLLRPGGSVVIVEWMSEDFDEATARWCFERLASGAEQEHGWLHHHRERWLESGLDWDSYRRAWTETEGLHRGRDVAAALQQRFEALTLRDGPYFFPELEVSRDDEQAAIDAGQIRPNCLQYVGRLRA